MTTNEPARSGEPVNARWLLLGVFIVTFYALVAQLGRDTAWTALSIGGLAALLVLGSYRLWRRASVRFPVPAAEYLALVWLTLYAALFVVDGAAAGRDEVINWLFLLPPLSILPIAARWLMGDDGNPRGLARSTAYFLHQTIGILLTGLGLVFVVGVFFIFAAPLSLVPGIMHLRAAHLYRRKRRPRVEADPRRGFMDR
jgi:hypothetical protein